MEDDLNFKKWKTTSIFLELEDDLNFSRNGKRPQLAQLSPSFLLGLLSLIKGFPLKNDKSYCLYTIQLHPSRQINLSNYYLFSANKIAKMESYMEIKRCRCMDWTMTVNCFWWLMSDCNCLISSAEICPQHYSTYTPSKLNSGLYLYDICLLSIKYMLQITLFCNYLLV